MFKTIDLFSGIGGIRRGFELTGMFQNVLSAEIDKYACKTYEHLFKENPYNDVTSEEFKNKVERIDYDTLLAGFPCQSFSRAGKKEGFLDATRGTLFFDIADIIKRTRPKQFLLENVDNLVSHDKGNTFKVILEVLINELNYKIIGVKENKQPSLLKTNKDLTFDKNSFIRNTKNFGLPQNRPRVYIMGFSKDYYDNLDLLDKVELPSEREKGLIYKDLNDLLEFKAPKKYYLAEGYLDSLKRHKSRHKGKGNGFGYIVVNNKDIKKPISNAILATGGSGKERNLVFDPQDGISGLKVKGKKTPLNNEFIRFMTPIEWGKLQGFINYGFLNERGEDEFSIPNKMSDTQLYKQFGNSVSIPVIEEMANFMIKCIKTLEKEIVY